MAKAVPPARTTRSKKNGSNGSGAESMPNNQTDVTSKRSTGNVEEKIRQRAYELFQQSGAEHGRDQEHWFRAEAEVRGKTA